MLIKTPQEAYEWAYDKGLTFPKHWYITPNFKWNEVFTNETDADGIPIYEVFENALEIGGYAQRLRYALEKPIHVHCWVRQIAHNKRVGSTAKYSAHINGAAIDFHVDGLSESQIRDTILAERIPVRIEADTVGWVHIDRQKYIKPFTPGIFKPHG